MQGSISNPTHLIEGFIDGLNARRPALFNVYSPCMPEQGLPTIRPIVKASSPWNPAPIL